MKRIIVLIILIVMLPVSSYGYFYTRSSLVADAREYDKWIAGVKYDHTKLAQYHGFVMGVYDTTGWMFDIMSGYSHSNQLLAIVSKHIKDHPKDWNLPAYGIVIVAFMEAFGMDEKKKQLFDQVMETMMKRDRDIYDNKTQ